MILLLSWLKTVNKLVQKRGRFYVSIPSLIIRFDSILVTFRTEINYAHVSKGIPTKHVEFL